MTKKNCLFSFPCDKWHIFLFVLVCLLGGALVGSLMMDVFAIRHFHQDQKVVRAYGETYVAVRNLTEDFLVELGKEDGMVVYDGKTWIPVNGNPVEVVVLNDSTCGPKCDTGGPINALRTAVTPALLVREVDVSEAEGEALIAQFEFESVPQYILSSGIETIKTPSGALFIEEQAPVLVEKEGQYLVDGSKVGFDVGKFLTAPVFELDQEPVLGSGKVRVVEFTDYQCPYCKRLHDNNAELIERLVAEGKIEYMVKDFPLGFHAEAPGVHKAANCVLKQLGSEGYYAMSARIFDTQRQWSGKGEAANAMMKDLAVDVGAEATIYETCMADPEMDNEINADMAEGQKYGVSGTPALFIGTQVMPGAIGPEAFEAAVESEL